MADCATKQQTLNKLGLSDSIGVQDPNEYVTKKQVIEWGGVLPH